MKVYQKTKGTESSSFGTNGRVNHDSSKFYNSKLYKELTTKEQIIKDTNVFPEKLLNSTILGSAENMSMIPDNSLHLMITSPPYNVSKEYDEDLSLSEYLELLRTVFVETYRVLVNGGHVCINVANLGRKSYIPLSLCLFWWRFWHHSQIMSAVPDCNILCLVYVYVAVFVHSKIVYHAGSPVVYGSEASSVSVSLEPSWGGWTNASTVVSRA